MSRQGIRRGARLSLLVRRVMAMRVASGDPKAQMILDIARMFGVPVGLLLSRRDLRLPR